MTDPRPSATDRAAAIARARERTQAPPAKHPAAASRVMAAGVAASAGLMLVATMAAAAERETSPTPAATNAPQVVHRVVTIEIPAQTVAAAPVPVGAASPEPTVVREVVVLPNPASAPEAAPAKAEGS